MELKSELVAAMAKVWLNRQDAMGTRLRADDMPNGCPFLFPGEVPGQPVVDLKRFWHTQIGTTQRYAHLIGSPMQAGVNAVGEMLKPRLKVAGERDDAG